MIRYFSLISICDIVPYRNANLGPRDTPLVIFNIGGGNRTQLKLSILNKSYR